MTRSVTKEQDARHGDHRPEVPAQQFQQQGGDGQHADIKHQQVIAGAASQQIVDESHRMRERGTATRWHIHQHQEGGGHILHDEKPPRPRPDPPIDRPGMTRLLTLHDGFWQKDGAHQQPGQKHKPPCGETGVVGQNLPEEQTELHVCIDQMDEHHVDQTEAAPEIEARIPTLGIEGKRGLERINIRQTGTTFMAHAEKTGDKSPSRHDGRRMLRGRARKVPTKIEGFVYRASVISFSPTSHKHQIRCESIFFFPPVVRDSIMVAFFAVPVRKLF